MVLSLAGPCAAWADVLADGAQAYNRGEFAEAARLWRPLAQAGDADAQFALGTLYQTGRGVEQSDAKATEWFRRAARHGSIPAQYNLGNAYKHGRGVAPDEAKAFIWWHKAAQAGLAPAQFNVGTAYLYGRGVARSETQGVEWYRRAAANGHPGARAALEQLAALQAGGADEGGAPWVRARAPDHFTLQLRAAETAAEARRYIASLPRAEYVLCAYRSQGKRWWAVLTGDYPDAATAQRAASEWRQHSEPWVRRFGSLQSQLVD